MPLSRLKQVGRCFICGEPIYQDTDFAVLDLHESGMAHGKCLDETGLDEAIAMIEDGNRND